MRITNIRTQKTEGKVSLLCDCKIRPIGKDTIYFTFDSKYSDYIYEDASPFAAGLFVPCMVLGEDLVIEGSISKKLYEGMYKIMDIMVGWNIGLKKIKIIAEKVVEDENNVNQENIGTFFSGGVDSFYTYLKHKNDPVHPISHLILIDGSDIDLSNKNLWDCTKKNVKDTADEGKISVLTVETNLQSLLEPMTSPDITHGGSLAAAALCVRRGFKNIFIPSSLSIDEQVPCGTHIDIDKHWSTEIISFEHDGAEATRFQKIEWQIAKSPVALKYLRVCFMNKVGKYNCGHCEKCLRTMVDLYLAGSLKESKTFPQEIDLIEAAKIISNSGNISIAYKNSLDILKNREGDNDLKEAIKKGLLCVKDPVNSLKDKLFKSFLYIDHRYIRGKLHKVYKLIRR